MPMSHGANKDSSQVAPITSLPPTRFSPVLFVFLQEILSQPCFAPIRLFAKDNAFLK